MAIHFTCCFDKGLLCRTPECRIFDMFFLHACRLVHCNLSNMVPDHKPKEYLLLTLILINNVIEHLLWKFSFSFLTNERLCITWMQLPFNLTERENTTSSGCYQTSKRSHDMQQIHVETHRPTLCSNQPHFPRIRCHNFS